MSIYTTKCSKTIKCITHETHKKIREELQTITITVKTNKNTVYERQYNITNHSKNENHSEERMKITMNITVFTKGVSQYNHSLLILFITFAFSKITVMFVNFSL